MLKVSIIGQDTLAAAIIACCKRHFDVTIVRDDSADVLWITYDTPIAADGRPDGDWVIDRIREQLVDFGTKPLILISSQLPVGTTAKLEQEFPEYHFAHSPENIRVASGVADFENQARVVVGMRTSNHHAIVEELFAPFTKNLIFTDPETAECVKHFLNCLLGMTIAYANEMSRVCKAVGADPDKVSLALRTDQRFSLKTPLRPGAPFGGGHLARDIFTVNEIADRHGIAIPLIAHIGESNGILS